jgi:hypothetical protein
MLINFDRTGVINASFEQLAVDGLEPAVRINHGGQSGEFGEPIKGQTGWLIATTAGLIGALEVVMKANIVVHLHDLVIGVGVINPDTFLIVGAVKTFDIAIGLRRQLHP